MTSRDLPTSESPSQNLDHVPFVAFIMVLSLSTLEVHTSVYPIESHDFFPNGILIAGSRHDGLIDIDCWHAANPHKYGWLWLFRSNGNRTQNCWRIIEIKFDKHNYAFPSMRFSHLREYARSDPLNPNCSFFGWNVMAAKEYNTVLSKGRQSMQWVILVRAFFVPEQKLCQNQHTSAEYPRNN